MTIDLILITEDPLSKVVAEKILAGTSQDYKVVNSLCWNKDKIISKIKDINRSAKGHVYLVLTDQDTKDRCPPDAITELQEPIHQNLFYRFAVMEIESWVMAHRGAISSFLSVPIRKIPTNPDTISNPKEHLIQLARSSKSGRIRRELVPRPNSTNKVGPDYNGRLSEFVVERWDVRVASQSSPSLQRTFKRLQQFALICV